MSEATMTHDAVDRVEAEYITFVIDGQLFGLSISRVQHVFVPERLTRVPLAAPDIAGVLNLRGRIVTAIDLRRRLGLAARSDDRPPMAIGVELRGESYGLLIDSVGAVMRLGGDTREPNPVNLDARLARVAAGVQRLDGQLLVILDVDRILDVACDTLAA